MLQLVEIRGRAGILSLPLADATLGYDLKEVEGLDPVKANIVSSSFAQQDGSQFQSARRDERFLKLTIGLNPDYSLDTVYSLRRRLYPFFMPKTPVELRFYMSDGLRADISGRVETMAAPMFAEDPQAIVDITCFDPDFIEPEETVVSGMSTSGTIGQTVNYSGSVETGIKFQLDINRTLSSFALYHQTPDGSIKVTDFQAALQAGDVIKINTIPGEKSVIRTRGSTDTSLLYAVSPQSNWIELEPGANNIRVYAAGAGIPYTITYTRRYGGL